MALKIDDVFGRLLVCGSLTNKKSNRISSRGNGDKCRSRFNGAGLTIIFSQLKYLFREL